MHPAGNCLGKSTGQCYDGCSRGKPEGGEGGPGKSTKPEADTHYGVMLCCSCSDAATWCSLAPLQVRLPLRLRVWRAHGRVARGGSSTPSAAGPGNPALSGPQSGGPWLSSVLSGEAQVDLSALVSAAAVRRHQPNTRYRSTHMDVHVPLASKGQLHG